MAKQPEPLSQIAQAVLDHITQHAPIKRCDVVDQLPHLDGRKVCNAFAMLGQRNLIVRDNNTGLYSTPRNRVFSERLSKPWRTA